MTSEAPQVGQSASALAGSSSTSSSINSSTPSLSELYAQTDFYIGVGLAISSCFFIGSSFIIKKKALIRLNRHGEVRASAGGFGYLKEWIWWAGLLTMGLGEAANFAAYAFAPASLVTPLGALSVIISAVMASRFLNEKLNLLGKLGCFLCIIGSTIIVLHSPKEKEIEDLEILFEKLQDPGFILYVIVIIGSTIFVACFVAPRHGHSNVVIYIFLCSGIGSLTVMSCKALGLAIRDTIAGKNDFATWMPWFLILITVTFIAIQMNYLNKALDIFNTGIVTPIYYVMFTTLVITASAILFKEFSHMRFEDILGDICGFLVVISAVFMLNAFKDLDISLNDVRGIMRPKMQRLNQFDEEVLVTDDSKERRFSYGSGDIYRKA
ncbi:LOW QUALITY PROTEIN: magnesium transporter NIPA2-like [Lucilia sericata]|uniref:magnesium transporter NIPA2-like n=1 Tax=Lucilia sericata TaxID=13632 RepID=UPI0018A829EC|nr:magnesium transporter NIPA2-like [Lucilia sericata]XP_037822348.1 LOW QUALITY PROTEIN: magnesium transporter NIPA2-like [Lucilia sericata]